jgi:hypothetical protein
MTYTVPHIHKLLFRRYCTPICYSVARGGCRTEFSESSNGNFVVLVLNNVNTSCLINDSKLSRTGIVIRDFKTTSSPSACGSQTPQDQYETKTLCGTKRWVLMLKHVIPCANNGL